MTMIHRKFIITIGVLACLAIWAVAGAAPSARALVKEGLREFEAERYDAALEKFQQAKTADPEFTGIDLNIGHALMKLGKIEEAEQHYEELLKSPDGAQFGGDISYNRGVAHFQRGAEMIPDPTVEGLVKQGLLDQKTSPEGQPSLELKPEAAEILQKSIEEYERGMDATKAAVPQMQDSREARANYELTRRRRDMTQKLLELFQPPQQQQQQNEKQEEKQNEKQDEQQQQNDQNQQNEENKEEQNNQEQEQNKQQEQQSQDQNQQEQQQQQDQQQQQQGQQGEQKDGEPQNAQTQDAKQADGMRPEDAAALLNTLNDQPHEEQLKEMIRYQMRGMRPLNPDW